MRRKVVASLKSGAEGFVARANCDHGYRERDLFSFIGNPRVTPKGISIIVLICIFICLGTLAAGAQLAVQGQGRIVKLGAVVNFKELARREPATPLKSKRKVIPFLRGPGARPLPAGVALPPTAQPQHQEAAPSGTALLPSPSVVAGFAALGDNDSVIPPDTQGAVGPGNLMVTLNSQVAIQDRAGTASSTVSLNSFWSSLSGVSGVFDPRLAYDPYDNRWIFVAASNADSTASKLLVGVSQSSDPSGTWNLYETTVDGTGTDWGDYPSMGFNKDWVVVDLNLFSISGGTFHEGQIYAFSKADLYAGLVSVRVKVFTDANGFTVAPAATYDNTLATEYLIQSWNGNSGGSGYLSISTITGAVGSEVYTAQVALPSTANPWAGSPPGGNDFAPQEGSTHLIQNGDDRIINAVYRNGYLWAAQNAFLPAATPTRTAAQWWQFAATGTVHQFGRVDDSTGTIFYAYPSIAVNANNDAVLGYSSFSANQFASANYSIRLADDPANTMRSETVLKAGEAVYYKIFSGSENRWGDYSNTIVDPSNDLDIWTIQEYASSPNFINGDNRWGTWWGKIGLKKRRGQVISE
ncbi:MAG TPA: hypothetical protein VG028_11740 [Terriglobia bacterium]|nr:hypothetical protein [Terriglobia bacterium]